MRIERMDDRCNNCMLCVRDCVAGVWREKEGRPAPVCPSACNLCGHCVAVCPKGAVIHSGLDAGQADRVRRKLIDADVYRETVMSRRSVRQYRDIPVEPEKIEQILDLARYSPTASNAQNVSYIVITNRKLIEDTGRRVFAMGVRAYRWANSIAGRAVLFLFKNNRKVAALERYMAAMDYYIPQWKAGRDYILHNAPVLVLVCAPAKADFAVDNCNIAATNIVNYAHALGLGSCYIGFLTLVLKRSRKMRKLLGVPENRKVYASLVLGYPAYRHSFVAPRKQPDVTWR